MVSRQVAAAGPFSAPWLVGQLAAVSPRRRHLCHFGEISRRGGRCNLILKAKRETRVGANHLVKPAPVGRLVGSGEWFPVFAARLPEIERTLHTKGIITGMRAAYERPEHDRSYVGNKLRRAKS